MVLYEKRIENLQNLARFIEENEQLLCQALYDDLGKSFEEAKFTEIMVVKREIKYHLKHLRKFMKKRVVRRLGVVKSTVVDFPYENALIISPWNYPVNISLMPIIGALSAGVAVTFKPSEISSAVEKIYRDVLPQYFSEDSLKVVTGGPEVVNDLIDTGFDVVFFTGSTEVGRLVYERASKQLSKVILELGGKSPTIITKSANLKLAVKKIIWGKEINSGQTCVAPDYILIDETVYQEFFDLLCTYLSKDKSMYKIVSPKHQKRLVDHLKNSEIIYGGEYDDSGISFTLTSTNIDEEIFGPILPIIKYKNIEEVPKYIAKYPNPLALYLFTTDKKEYEMLEKISFGGGCVNDVIIHIIDERVPFGGVKESGLGNYHGYQSYKAFTYERVVVSVWSKFDLKLRYFTRKFK